jgi:hypothetical protein
VLAAVGCVCLAASFGLPLAGRMPCEELVKTSAWGLAILGAFAGWGTLLARVCSPGERAPIALRAVWGASLLVAAGGALAAGSLLSRPFLWAYVAVGDALLGASFLERAPAANRRAGAVLRALRGNPGAAVIGAAVLAMVVVNYLGAASYLWSNPYDDDVAYYPFAKQLLDRGTLIDPFSFRRMSTLGGQALFHALLMLRITPLHLNLLDRGMCFVLCAGLVVSMRVEGRAAPWLARVLSVTFLALMPNIGINSASYYSGLAFFLAFFVTLERLPRTLEPSPRLAARRVLPLVLTGAAICTLRQNYQTAVALVLVISYVFAIQRAGVTRRVAYVEPLVGAALLGAFLAPWLLLLYRSNATFLFPIMRGTLRAGIPMRSVVMTPSQLFRFGVRVWLAPEPTATIPLFALVGLLLRQASPRRTLTSQWLATLASMAMLSVGFSLAHPRDIARYDFAFLAASALVTWHVAAARAVTAAGNFQRFAPAAVLLFGLLFPLFTQDTRTPVMEMMKGIDEMLRRTAPPQAEPPVAAAYHHIQQATPAGARLLVMLDQPYFLDYARNEIWNLDMPGTSSPGPGIPCFRGPEAVARYLREQGVRYLAIVRSERSVYLYRRGVWFDHLYDAAEIWRVFAPYMVDVMDNVWALAETRKKLAEDSGMVLLDISEPASP